MTTLVERIQKLHFTPRKKVISLLFGQYHSVFKGRGIEFEDLREYIIGDNIKDIDWKSTAKTGNVHVKKYKETRELHILFALDISSSMNWESNSTKVRLEQAIDFITLVSLIAIANNDTIGLILFDKTIRKSLPFKRGQPQLIRVLHEIEQETAHNYWHETAHEDTLRFLLNGVKKKTICFYLTDSLDVTSNPSLLRAVRRKHEFIMTHLGDKMLDIEELKVPLQFQDIETGKSQAIDFQDAEMQSMYAEYLQDLQHKKDTLRKNGIEYLALHPEDDMVLTLYRFLKGRSSIRSISP